MAFQRTNNNVSSSPKGTKKQMSLSNTGKKGHGSWPHFTLRDEMVCWNIFSEMQTSKWVAMIWDIDHDKLHFVELAGPVKVQTKLKLKNSEAKNCQHNKHGY